MRWPLQSSRRLSPAARLRIRRWLRNERGAAAIEFALVALPFFMFVLGTMGIGLYFFTSSSLDYGVESAARKVRTGEAQRTSMTVAQFRQLVCDQAGTYITCSKLRVLVQHADQWADLVPQTCLDNSGNLVASTGNTSDMVSQYTGAASEVVLVTLCYPWDLASSFGFLKLGKNSDGSGPAIFQSGAAFRTEPYS